MCSRLAVLAQDVELITPLGQTEQRPRGPLGVVDPVQREDVEPAVQLLLLAPGEVSHLGAQAHGESRQSLRNDDLVAQLSGLGELEVTDLQGGGHLVLVEGGDGEERLLQELEAHRLAVEPQRGPHEDRRVATGEQGLPLDERPRLDAVLLRIVLEFRE